MNIIKLLKLYVHIFVFNYMDIKFYLPELYAPGAGRTFEFKFKEIMLFFFLKKRIVMDAEEEQNNKNQTKL